MPIEQNIEPRKRKRYHFHENRTISRSANYHIHKEVLEDLDLASDLIEDHAYRRVQLFYYLLLLYYRENAHIELTKTRHQHGRSKCPNCSAAHSSILPNVVDDKGLLSHDMQLYNNMNSTVEAPKIVNEYDCFLENRIRIYAVDLLNHVSNNGIHPYIGLNAFVHEMKNYFEVSKSEINSKMKLIGQIRKVESYINELELFKLKDPLVWMAKYTQAVKKLNRLREIITQFRTCSGSAKPDNYSPERADLFSIINMVFPDKINYISSIKNESELRSFALSTKLIFPFFPQIKNLSKNALKKQIINFYCHFGHLETFIVDKEKANTVFMQTIAKLNCLTPLNPERYSRQMAKLIENLKVIELEGKASVLPPFKYLSGKMVGNVLKPMNKHELLEQKKELTTYC